MIYLTDGNVPLNAAYADEIVQIDRNTYQLTFKFPTNNVLWQRLREETFLTADDLHGEQDFVIFEVEKQHGYIHVYANQVMTLLNHYVVHPINLDRETGSTALSRFAGSITRDNPFSFFSDIDDRHTFNTDTTNAMEALTKDKHSILGQWGGDLVRHGYQVRLLKNGGSENESLFMYKKNLSSYQHKTSTKSLKTRITFKTTVKGEGKNADDKHYKVVVDSPLINKYSQIYEDVVEVNDQDVKDEASLREYGKQYFRTSLCDLMEDSLEIDVVGQSDVPVQMFDVVGIYHETFDLDVRKKITKYTYSPMAKKLKSIGFGEFKSGLAHAIGNVVSDAVKNETYIFEAKLEKEIKNADLDFDRKVQGIKNEITDGIEQAKALAEQNKKNLSDEINRRFQEFNPSGFEETKAKAEEALRKAGASADLIEEAKQIVANNTRDLNAFKTSTQKEREKLSDELKRYSREEAENKLTEIREVLASDYVSKRTYVEDVEGTRQRLEAITLDNKTKLAEYKQTVDGQFTNLSSQIANKVDRLDFQQVKETSQLFERILGRTDSNVASNVARMALTSELFEVEVGKRFSNLTNLFYAPTKIPKYISSVATDKHLERVSWGDHDGIRINYTDSMSGWLGVMFPLTKKFVKQGEGLGYRIEIAVDKVPRDGRVLIQLLDNTTKASMYYNSQILLKKTGNQVFTGYLDIPRTGELHEYCLRFTLASPGNIVIHKPMIIDKRIIPEEFVDSTDYNNEYNRVTMSLMKDSFAIKSLNSAGDLIAGINIGANGNNRIVGKATHITGDTLIDNAVIKSAMIDKLKTANFEAGSVTTTILGANSVTADKVLMDQAMARKFVSNDIFTDTLAAKTAFINKLRSVVVTATLLEGFKGRIGGFQIGTHDKDPSVYWLTGTNQFAVGMSNGSSGWGQTALWVNWGDNWNKAGDYAWFVKRTGEMFCYNKAQFWNTPVVHGNLIVTGHIFYDNRQSGGKAGHWVSSENYSRIDPSGGSLYLYYSGGGYDWIPMNKDVSDRRYKHNIEDSKVSALEVINRLKTYSYRKEYDGKIEDISCGIMAQDVQKYAPEAFLENPDGAYSYNTFVLVPYLIKAIQELNQKLEKANEGRN
jgi:phage minor structural protein, N-terminal domain protein|nr:MAG TPA: Neck appendage protein [Caudoviricetes sp.]